MEPNVSARSEAIARYKARLSAAHEAIYDSARVCDTPPVRLLTERSDLIDRTLSDLWKETRIPETLSLAAVGGYGRGELWPNSDIDILLLLPGTPDREIADKLEQLISFFWDIGLKIGHSVRTPEDCFAAALDDLTVQTALLEARYLTGNHALFAKFQSTFKLRIDATAFYTAKKLEQYERYLRFQDAHYLLEPNCKEGPGGLRDLQMVLWIAKAANAGNSWDDLARCGFITASEKELIETGESFLQRLRILLHLCSGRHEDRLLFDYQEKIANRLGFTPSATKRASERMMQDYFLTARTIIQANTILLQNLGAVIFPSRGHEPIPLNERFQNTYQLLDVTAENVFNENPNAIFEPFELMQEHPELKGLTARTIRALWRANGLIDEAFRNDPANRARFINLFRREHGVLTELRRMHQLGMLGAYLPKFGAIIGQMQYDLFHVYTVDQHTLLVLRGLRRFTRPEFAHEYPLCSQVMADLACPWLLYIAALFHDIAKGRSGDHPELGAADAREFCRTHGLSDDETERVAWLVQHHLVMSDVAQKKDSSDPDVISSFASLVGDDWRLSALYLLTVADIRGTSPKVWNGWKARLLEELYKQTRDYLSSDRKPAEAIGLLRERQIETLRLLRYFAVAENAQNALWKEFDTAYFIRHSPEEIAWHTRLLYYRVNSDRPVVTARMGPDGEGIGVMVYAHDQCDLFARLVSFFNHIGYTIVEAKIQTTRHGYALDTFLLFDVTERDSDRDMLAYIEYELAERLIHQTPPEAPGKSRISRQVRHFPIQPQVSIRPDERGVYSMLSISAADRPGLLYTIAHTLVKHNANLHTAKIVTLGERVEDNFLISGGSLNDSAGRIQLETELLNKLEVPM